MRTVSGTEFQRRAGTIIEEVMKGATVTITAHGRPQVVMVSPEEYQNLRDAQSALAWDRVLDRKEMEPQ